MIKLKVNLTVFVVSCLFVNPVQLRTNKGNYNPGKEFKVSKRNKSTEKN